MGTAVCGVNVVGKGEQGGVVAVIVLQRHLDGGMFPVARIVDDILVQDIPDILFALVDIVHKAADTALIVQHLADRLFAALVAEGDVDPAVEECLLAQTLEQHVIVVPGGFGKNLGVGFESHLRTCFGGWLNLLQVADRLAILKALVVTVVSITDFDLQPLGQGIDYRCTNPVQTAGNLVSAAAEFSSCVQDGKDNGDSRDAQFWLDADRNSSTVILDADDVARQQVHQNLGTMTCKDLVDCIVHNLIHQMMQTLWSGGTDVHTGTLAHRVQSLQDLNITGIILLCHLQVFFRCVFQNVSPPSILMNLFH